jgi:hypothetical protein
MSYLECSNSKRETIEWWFLGSEKGGNEELFLIGYIFSASDEEKVLKMNSGDDCTVLWIFFIHSYLYLGWLKGYAYFTTIIFPQKWAVISDQVIGKKYRETLNAY